MCLASPAGFVFTNDGELVKFDELSCTFSKMKVSKSDTKRRRDPSEPSDDLSEENKTES